MQKDAPTIILLYFVCFQFKKGLDPYTDDQIKSNRDFNEENEQYKQGAAKDSSGRHRLLRRADLKRRLWELIENAEMSNIAIAREPPMVLGKFEDTSIPWLLSL
ncbi:unnamed protein product [Allacma fusca]|uniref:Uncharacterized protein n=1 Tax=Allacma fusca TaxID=39272 RepID=A0A8J2NLD8_9HEXA|nr:unnamed protein product [Allacma fusca]